MRRCRRYRRQAVWMAGDRNWVDYEFPEADIYFLSISRGYYGETKC